jgi:hypothetical protein
MEEKNYEMVKRYNLNTRRGLNASFQNKTRRLQIRNLRELGLKPVKRIEPLQRYNKHFKPARK